MEYEKVLANPNSYRLNRKQCVRINNVTSTFETIISGVSQGLFNCFFNNFFYFIEKQVFTILRMTTP